MRYEEPSGYTITDGETSATFGSASFPNIEGRWHSSSHVTTCNPINHRVGWELQSGFKRDCLRQDQIRYGFDSLPAQSSLFQFVITAFLISHYYLYFSYSHAARGLCCSVSSWNFPTTWKTIVNRTLIAFHAARLSAPPTRKQQQQRQQPLTDSLDGRRRLGCNTPTMARRKTHQSSSVATRECPDVGDVCPSSTRLHWE